MSKERFIESYSQGATNVRKIIVDKETVICYFVPSSAAFEGIMNLANSDKSMIAKDMFILISHGMIWFLLYLSISKWQKKHS